MVRSFELIKEKSWEVGSLQLIRRTSSCCVPAAASRLHLLPLLLWQPPAQQSYQLKTTCTRMVGSGEAKHQHGLHGSTKKRKIIPCLSSTWLHKESYQTSRSLLVCRLWYYSRPVVFLSQETNKSFHTNTLDIGWQHSTISHDFFLTTSAVGWSSISFFASSI